MKSLIAAKMIAMRKRSALSSSTSALDRTPAPDSFPASTWVKEPSSHHGTMRILLDEGTVGCIEESVDVVFCIAVDSVHAVTEVESSLVFEAYYTSIKEITWDYTECSVCFRMDDGFVSPLFTFVTTLTEVETQLTSAFRAMRTQHLPDQVYVGVLVGRSLPSSPIQQRRFSSINPTTLSLPAPLRRELLSHERPPRTLSSREKLAMLFLKSGTLTFPCSINGDARGLKLDSDFLLVFPSPECHERSACLFSYHYWQVESCDVRSGTRLELRLNRSGAKQPTFIAFQSPDAMYIRDAIWFYKNGMSIDQYYRRELALSDVNTPKSGWKACLSPRVGHQPWAPRATTSRRASLRSFPDDNFLKLHIQSLCVVIGCSHRCADVMNAQIAETRLEVDASGACGRRRIWFCDDHAAPSDAQVSPPRSPSKRHGLLSRVKSTTSVTPLIHRKHYAQSIKYHGVLFKRCGKYQLTKTWSQKIVVLIDTPIGGCLCYFNKLSHCPGLTDTSPKERRSIDLSSVICIRRETTVGRGPGVPPYAFDIVTLFRTWTFATNDLQEFEVWLSILAEATETSSSLSPDRPLRFSVKCLRDPLCSLLLRSDAMASLEVSSNGVTIFSDSEREVEVYSWYFTDIQKWSVAKQHDGTSCCFLSCATNCTNASFDRNPGVSFAASRYSDFLLQTTESEAICTAIEFFVGKCMAKLEILGMMHKNALSHPLGGSLANRSGECHEVASCTKSRGAIVGDTPQGFTTDGHVLESGSNNTALTGAPVRLNGPALPVATKISPVEREDLAESHTNREPTDDLTQAGALELRTAELLISCAKLDANTTACDQTTLRDENVLEKDCIRLDVSDETPINLPDGVGQVRDVDFGGWCDKGEGSALTVVRHHAGDRVSLGDDCEEASAIVVSCQCSIPDSMPPPDSTDDMAIRSGSMANLKSQSLENNIDANNDRFQSFEYCECTVGDAIEQSYDLRQSQQSELCSNTDATYNEDDDLFEDARCDSAEYSAVLLDGVPENDEDSVIIVESEEPNGHDVIGDIEPQFDPVDVIETTSGDGSGECIDENKGLAFRCEAGHKASVPIYMKRSRAEEVLLPELDYDEMLPRITVYSVHFKHGHLCRL